MNSEHVHEELDAYLDGELDAAARQRAEAHLASCLACREGLEELRAVHAGLRDLPAPEPGPRYWSRFAARVGAQLPEQAPAPKSGVLEHLAGWLFPAGRLGWLRPAGVIATATFLLYIGLHGYRSSEQGGLGQGVMPQAEAPLVETEKRPAGKDKAVERREPQQAEESKARREVEVPGPLAAGQGRSKALAQNLPPREEPLVEGAPPVPRADAGPLAAASRPASETQAKAERQAEAPGEGPMQGAAGEGSAGVQARGEAIRDLVVREGVRSPAGAPQAIGPAGKFALSPAPMLRGGRVGEIEVQASATVEKEVARFVAAAAASDTAAARSAFQALEARRFAAAGPGTREQMLHWLEVASLSSGSAGSAVGPRVVRPGRLEEAPPNLEALLALDALVWPRRDAGRGAATTGSEPTEIEAAMRYLARAFATRASDARARDRARLYSSWLVSRTSGAERAGWEALLRTLP